MVDKKVKSEAVEPKAKVAKKVATAPKAKAEAAQKKEVAAKQVAAPVKEKKVSVPSGKTLTITQIASPIGRLESQRATLIGLGLNKIRRSRTIVDTPSVRGMIEKVKHLVTVKE